MITIFVIKSKKIQIMAASMYYIQLTYKRHTEKFVTGKITVIHQHLKETLEQLKIDSQSILEQLPAYTTIHHHAKNLKYENKLEYTFEDITVQITKAKFIQRLKDL